MTVKKVPSWSDLGNRLFPPAPPPVCVDCLLHKEWDEDETTPGTRLYRERNCWCVYSARLWLALELKGINYDTFLVEARFDTYDGSIYSDMDDGRPKRLSNLALPQLQFPENNSMQLHCGATEATSLDLLQQLDVAAI